MGDLIQRGLPAKESDHDCFWCWTWQRRQKPATSKYRVQTGLGWVYVCDEHLAECGPKGDIPDAPFAHKEVPW